MGPSGVSWDFCGVWGPCGSLCFSVGVFVGHSGALYVSLSVSVGLTWVTVGPYEVPAVPYGQWISMGRGGVGAHL